METQGNFTAGRPKLSVGYFFLSLGVLVTLITTVTALLNMVFDSLNKKFPDALNAMYTHGYNSYEYESIRMSLATLVIFFPIFLLVSYFWRKAKGRGLGSLDAEIRKWLIYILLFLSAVVIAVDLVTLVRYFVSGEITGRFLLKIAATLVVALVVGFYYISELRERVRLGKVSVSKLSALVAVVMVVGAVCFSFCVMGSPAEQRALRMDDRRLQDLQNIQWSVISFWQQKEVLPESLEDLKNPLSGYYLPVDPEFDKGKSYEYAKTRDMTFELCAEFARPMPEGWLEYSGGGGVRPMISFSEGRDMAVSSYPYPGGGMNESWDHEAGRTCFERTIDPDIYPPYPKPDAR